MQFIVQICLIHTVYVFKFTVQICLTHSLFFKFTTYYSIIFLHKLELYIRPNVRYNNNSLLSDFLASGLLTKPTSYLSSQHISRKIRKILVLSTKHPHRDPSYMSSLICIQLLTQYTHARYTIPISRNTQLITQGLQYIRSSDWSRLSRSTNSH